MQRQTLSVSQSGVQNRPAHSTQTEATAKTEPLLVILLALSHLDQSLIMLEMRFDTDMPTDC